MISAGQDGLWTNFCPILSFVGNVRPVLLSLKMILMIFKIFCNLPQKASAACDVCYNIDRLSLRATVPHGAQFTTCKVRLLHIVKNLQHAKEFLPPADLKF